MIDPLGRPQSVLLLGGTSEIGLAILRALPQERLTRVVLAGRDPAALHRAADQMRADRGGRAPVIEVLHMDATDTDTHERVIDDAFDGGDVDITVMGVGELGDQEQAAAQPAVAVRSIQVGFVGPLSLMLHVGRRLRGQGHGVLVVLSSVAGRQARPRNWIYGSGKAGLDLAALGLGDALRGSGGRVLVVRPGFVRTRMTAHLTPPPLAVHPDDVARAVVKALGRRTAVVYSPAAARLVGAALAVLPRTVLRRLPF